MNFRTDRPGIDARIEMTPLIDVVFQLLIFFLLTTSFINERAIEVDLPEAQVEEESRNEKDLLLISVDRDGDVFHGEAKVSWSELSEVLRRTAEKDKKREVMIRGDRAVPHGQVVRVMDLARRHGLTNMAIVAVAPESE